MTTATKRPQIILGTMTFGMQADERTSEAILARFLEAGGQQIDTAYDYGKGSTEEILGRLLPGPLRRQVKLATKANPWTEGGLKPSSIRRQLETSLQRLQTEQVDLFYLHAPDNQTPVEETLQECQKLFAEGKFRLLGLSNYAAWQVVDIFHLCRRNGWIAPTVYQGMYNGLTRGVEAELFPALRNCSMAFYAYNPLAGGLLTGKYAGHSQPRGDGRFKLWDFYQERYWKETYFEAFDEIRKTCESYEVPPAEAALRWILYHSRLESAHGDALILGASNADQLTANLESCARGALPKKLQESFARAWELARPFCALYFRT